MGLLLFILLVILIAVFGFWDTLAAVLGAAAVVVLLIVIGLGILLVAGVLLFGRARGP